MRSFEDMFEPDERSCLSGNELENLYQQLKQLELFDTAPKRVVELFETAKHLSLYAIFVYEFNPIAELVGFQALEQAVRTRTERDGLATKNKVFRELMDQAIRKNWIVEEDIANRRSIARARVEQNKIIDSLRAKCDEGEKSAVIDQPTEVEIDGEEREMKIVETVCSAAISLRNGLAHGELYLMPNSHRRLEVTAGLINQLFPPGSR